MAAPVHHPKPPPRLARAQEAAAGGWLAGLPALVDDVCARWKLTAERVVEPGGSSSMTVLVTAADGGRAALKISPPDGSAAAEEAALRRWNGLGAVRVLRSAPDAGALLLERLRGETSLRSLPDAKAMLEAVSVVRRLWVDPGEGHPFPTVGERTAARAALMRAAADDETGPLVDQALRHHGELMAAPGERLLLHGDFRQGIVLASDAERSPWLAVGPEPLVGERAYDLARLVRDRLHDLVASPGAAAITRRRVTRLAESVDLDPDRLRAWSHFRAVESALRNLDQGRTADAEMLLEFATWL
ncbi:aminoglycoside phosphotransferase family protein [Streptomyces sp. PT12]|uniref:aminoglycoside phosphotransferase family protein n=1 Tax=Streptomyces sp. PT12 TaxID=1510197 RepID=UPI000DE4D1BE|nr:aminoglycoside phosphotransferase family protein [Streptomyces sp. PT12]RBM05072.1 kinase [Streptomyces sp. PT12]